MMAPHSIPIAIHCPFDFHFLSAFQLTQFGAQFNSGFIFLWYSSKAHPSHLFHSSFHPFFPPYLMLYFPVLFFIFLFNPKLANSQIRISSDLNCSFSTKCLWQNDTQSAFVGFNLIGDLTPNKPFPISDGPEGDFLILINI
jgi:hypothetical protein